MQNYERLIYDLLPGSTPKEKYEKLKGLQETVSKICYPRRGTYEENMSIYDAADALKINFFNHEEAVNK